MPNVRFVIRGKSDSPQTVYVTARFGRNEKLMYATPLKVDSIFWDAERQRVKAARYCPYRDEVNDALRGLDDMLARLVTDSVRDGLPLTKDTYRHALDVHFGKARDVSHSFHDFFDEFTEECKTRMNEKRGGQLVTYKTQREYARTHYYIRMYEAGKKIVLGYQDIDQHFLSDFVSFLQGMNLSVNTISHKVICIKAVMRAAVERGLTDNMRWRFYRNSTEPSESVYLTEGELEKIHLLDLSKCPRLERVRDLFLCGCWTGLRFSDITRIKAENIEGGMIRIRQSKTNAVVTIPVHPVFGEIWERYGGDLPTDISNQKFNAYIKEVCRAAGITEKVTKTITKGGKRITTLYEKWELVASHTARRSFATNLYKSGFPAISIMKITGHKTESAFLKYIKVTGEEHANLLAEHWDKKGI